MHYLYFKYYTLKLKIVHELEISQKFSVKEDVLNCVKCVWPCSIFLPNL